MEGDVEISPELVLVDPTLRTVAVARLTTQDVEPPQPVVRRPPRRSRGRLLPRALGLVAVRLAWVFVAVGVPLVAVIATLALLAAGH